jgi:hypothetical protein
MTEFDIPGAMEEGLYSKLREQGWTINNSTSPDEWLKGQIQVWIIHVARSCEVRWRRDYKQSREYKVAKETTHAISVTNAVSRAQPWSMHARQYGSSRAEFVEWLGRVASDLVEEEGKHHAP